MYWQIYLATFYWQIFTCYQISAQVTVWLCVHAHVSPSCHLELIMLMCSVTALHTVNNGNSLLSRCPSWICSIQKIYYLCAFVYAIWFLHDQRVSVTKIQFCCTQCPRFWEYWPKKVILLSLCQFCCHFIIMVNSKFSIYRGQWEGASTTGMKWQKSIKFYSKSSKKILEYV